ncbi:MAG TPA: lysylphosphatidylglycerol synthase transmembrane domain-containing protein [Polyangiaceae bacterium]|nr:lysylphosphatidylglycerol synthase transmembrane domain-containing protein [Polyangiaceae bacterium]
MRRRRVSGAAALRTALALGASALVFWLILRFIRVGGGTPPLAAFAPSWALCAILLSTLQIAVVALRWSFFCRELGAPLVYRAALGAYYVSIFLNQLLPLGMLGDAFRGLWHARRLASGVSRGRPALDAATALILDRASGQLILLVLVLPILPFWWQPLRAAVRGSAFALDSRVLFGVFLAFAVIASLVWFLGRSGLRYTARARQIFFRPGALLIHGGCSLLALSLHLAAFSCTARALGFSLPFGLAARVVPLVLVASTLPSFALGTGAREAVAAVLYHLLGLRSAEGAAIALGLGLLGFVASLPGLLVLVLARLRPAPENAER